MLPLLKILIIEDSVELLEQLANSIRSTVESFERPDLDISVVESATVSEALQHVHTDGDIQAVIFSWDTTVLPHEINSRYAAIEANESPAETATGEQSLANNALVIEAIKAIRPELPVYVLGDAIKGLDIVNQVTGMESFFYRNDIISDPESILGYLINDFDDRNETHFWTAYKEYVLEANDSWHTPGHSGGASFRNSPYINDFYRFFGRNVFVSDLSVSVDSLGSLSDGTHAIGRAQEALATTFEVRRSYFVTNGSSTSNKIILQTLLREGDKVIADRNCHKSVHYGMVQARAMPLYLDSVFNPDYGIFSPPRLSQLKEMIEANPDAKLIVLTGCTYDGLLTDLKQVVELGHQHGMKVFIDEAWFAYSLFHPEFRAYSAIAAGADYVTHSAHKVVSAFSQASFIHVNDPDFDQDFFKEIYSIHTSTSPKYQLIASLDVCRQQLEMEGYKILNELLNNVRELKAQVAKFKRLRILEAEDFANIFAHFKDDNMGHDPLKILIDVSALEYSNQEIHRFLMDEVGLEIEKFTHSTLLVLLTLGGMRSKIVRLYNALKKLDEGKVSLNRSKQRAALPADIPPINLVTLPATAFFSRRESIAWQDSVGRIAAGLVTPYPPGIPLIIPGQRIEQAHIDYMRSLGSQKLTIQGLYDGELYVCCESDDQLES
ncbi:aminotransferase class I/II-fold pyridoxal phosphate-dependent enzyme [Reinekea thalattae]|uniref:Aminotransferase class V-fold PLP-dependent enzyme n=1 Tax=Reinekea thalattae TaxID=2593301 RepID=A0A5C8Z1I6_9GAMM|nr:aminotransferase class V-fold PLP-dependent enzyme [Reinekea thalattae]TXR51387.1 aminotransferase class V-fold PLP-dependent enzyme [Reinekea thalattae]